MNQFLKLSLLLVFSLGGLDFTAAAVPYFLRSGQPTDVTVVEGDDVSLTRRFDGFPPDVEDILQRGTTESPLTQRNGNVKNAAKFIVIITSRGIVWSEMFTVKHVDKTDEGIYKCFLRRVGHLPVSRRPSFRFRPKSVDRQSVILRCQLDNLDDKHFHGSWFRIDTEFSRGHEITKLSLFDTGEERTILWHDYSGVNDLTQTKTRKTSCQCGVFPLKSASSLLKSQIANILVLFPPHNNHPGWLPLTVKHHYRTGRDDIVKGTRKANRETEPTKVKKILHGQRKFNILDKRGSPAQNKWNLTTSGDGSFIMFAIKGPVVLSPRNRLAGQRSIEKRQVSKRKSSKKVRREAPMTSSAMTSSFQSETAQTTVMKDERTRTKTTPSTLTSTAEQVKAGTGNSRNSDTAPTVATLKSFAIEPSKPKSLQLQDTGEPVVRFLYFMILFLAVFIVGVVLFAVVFVVFRRVRRHESVRKLDEEHGAQSKPDQGSDNPTTVTDAAETERGKVQRCTDVANGEASDSCSRMFRVRYGSSLDTLSALSLPYDDDDDTGATTGKTYAELHIIAPADAEPGGNLGVLEDKVTNGSCDGQSVGKDEASIWNSDRFNTTFELSTDDLLAEVGASISLQTDWLVKYADYDF
ncbi:uncharacterized protein [Ptychodera flava]|uniref:uncharacterized protein n=1 Tax=Ptychodera flava TaxID=63121 RepID=UPI00396A6EE2